MVANSRILFLSHSSSLDGAERCLLDLVAHLDRRRFEPLVVLPWRGPMEEKLKQASIPYAIRFLSRWIPSRRNTSWHYPLRWFSGLRARLWSLLALIERENIDLVYTNTSTLLEGALAARRARLPHIWHIHEHLRGNADLHCFIPPFWIDKLTLALSTRIITPSGAVAQARFANAAKVCVVPNGIDFNAFHNGDGQRLRQELGISSQAPVITFIGAISRTKDPISFIRAAAIVQRRFPNAHFLVAGTVADPELERQARALVQTEGLKVHFLGYRHDVADLLAAATVHVSTSTQESFGRTLIEAMAAGTPVVATRCGGPEEVVVDGQTGFIVPPGDHEAVASAISTLLENPDTARKMGEAGRNRAYACFSVQAYADKISEVLDEVLQ